MIYLIEINLNLHICTFNCRQDIRHRYLVISPALLELIKINLIHRLFRASSLFALHSFSALSALSMIFWIFLVVLLPGTWLSVLSKFRMSRQAVPDPGLLISSALKTTKTPHPLRGFVHVMVVLRAFPNALSVIVFLKEKTTFFVSNLFKVCTLPYTPDHFSH